ncbi:MAG: Lrp/AsnC ligand binding domain-containing protein [Prevotellaceae bacterium]|jgi:Lrp/AsnC family transcriptional regulator for asnA, asnC and gidA|nr:Lrp/AsnC ligand binding domain-containing protein [Prevotellaceae bacterium]
MLEKIHLDSIDYKILTLLLKNARTPFLEIARECGISGAAIHQRVRKLEENGVIEGSRILIKPRAVGLDVCAFVNIKISQSNNVFGPILDALKTLPEIVECHCIVGEYSLLVKAYCRDNDHLMDLLVNRLPSLPGVSSTSSFISVSQPIERAVPVNSNSKKKKASYE